MRKILLATVASIAVAGAAVAGSPFGASGNVGGSFDYSKTTVDRSAYGAINNTYGFGATGVGRDLSAGAGASVGSGASQATTSNALRNGSSVSVAGASNFATTGSVAGAAAGFAGGAGSLFDDNVGVGAGLAAGVAGGLSGTKVGGTTFAANHSAGAADGTADAAQASFGQSTADANVSLFEVDQKLDTYEYGTTSEWLDVTDKRTTTTLSGEGTLFGNTRGGRSNKDD